MKARDKTIVVTGGGSGIGRELVLSLLKRGSSVAAIDINDTTLQETVSLANGNPELSVHMINITNKEAVMSLPEVIIKRHGSVDGIINNAGIIQPFIKINELDQKDIDRVFDVNFNGTLNMIKAFLPYLLKRPCAHIVNISSMGGFLPVPGQSIYGASKAAVKLLTEALYAELAETKISVTVVFPGAIKTNIASNSGLVMPTVKSDDRKKQNIKPTSAVLASEKIIDAMEKDKFRICVGNDSKLMDFVYRLNPRMATNFISRQMKSLLQ